MTLITSTFCGAYIAHIQIQRGGVIARKLYRTPQMGNFLGQYFISDISVHCTAGEYNREKKEELSYMATISTHCKGIPVHHTSVLLMVITLCALISIVAL